MLALLTITLADSWGWHHGDVGIGWWIVMMLGMVLFWGAIVVLVVWALRSGLGARRPDPDSAEEILRRRLADGSISVEEYEQRRASLETSASRPAA
jgi:putative membrane protein